MLASRNRNFLPLGLCVLAVVAARIVHSFDEPPHDDPPGLHNVHRASGRILSGSEPVGDAGFASIAKTGAKTVVSVDGARPDVETARKHNLRYVHIPIGYEGVPPEAVAALARVLKECDGPIYIHCHHGKHRGPAAAAVAAILEGQSRDQGRAFMERAGTGKNYAGLWRDVAACRAPAAGAKLPELVDIAKLDSLAATMAKIDRDYDVLVAYSANKPPASKPDAAVRESALLLTEALHESGRNLSADYDERFRRWLSGAEAEAAAVEQAVVARQPGVVASRLETLGKSCKQCHAAYRDNAAR